MAEWYDANNMGSSFPLLDYGSNQLAKYGSDALFNPNDPYAGLSSGQQVFGDGIRGTGVGNQFANARRRMTSDDAYRGTFPGSPYSPHRGFEEMEFDETVTPERTNWLTKGGNFLKKFSPTGIINTLTGRKGATESFGGYPGGWGSRAGLFPKEVQNLQALADKGLLRSGGKDAFGTNVVSMFGDYDKHMADKKAQFEAKLGEGETLKDLYDSYVSKYGVNSAIAKRLNHYANFGGATDVSAADKITTGAPKFITQRDTGAPVTTGGGGTFNPMLDERGRVHRGTSPAPSWRGATAAREAAGEQVAGPGFGRGAYWAEGGRVGYQDGELVEDESMFAATPRGMMEENIEEVQGEPSREQLEAIALEIFQLPLEELNEEQLNVVYQAAMEQEPSEEEVQFAAQEGPGEGIASLV